jgi:radical SAM superfamily enzyme YgiQ (UPF0313 family)/anti-anti-sigma regulatory factor
MSQHAPRAYRLARHFKDRGIPVVMGGVRATMMPEEAKQHVDTVVIGEAEGVWDKLLLDFAQGSLKPFYRSQGRPELTGLPHPRRDLLNAKAYTSVNCIETSRGCPFDCEFCSVTAFAGGTFRMRPVKDVIQEIESMKAKAIVFIDDNIVGNPRYAKELFEALIPLKIRWGGQASTTIARNKELLELARKSGCFSLFFGIETLSQDTLKSINKSFNRSFAYEEEFKRIHDAGIRMIGSFIFGFDHDDEGVFERTVGFAKKNRIDISYYNILTPLPGTKLFHRLKAQGRLLHENWEHYNGYEVVYRPKLLSPEALQQGFYWAYRQTYSYPSIVSRIALRPDALSALWTYVVNWGFRHAAYKGPKGSITNEGKLLGQLGSPLRIKKPSNLIPGLNQEFHMLKSKGLKALDEAKSSLRVQVLKDESIKALTVRLTGALDKKALKALLSRIGAMAQSTQNRIVIALSGLVFCSRKALKSLSSHKDHLSKTLGDKLTFENLKGLIENLGEVSFGTPGPTTDSFKP